MALSLFDSNGNAVPNAIIYHVGSNDSMEIEKLFTLFKKSRGFEVSIKTSVV